MRRELRGEVYVQGTEKSHLLLIAAVILDIVQPLDEALIEPRCRKLLGNEIKT